MASTTAKIWLGVLTLLVGVGIAVALYLWRQATALPEWYVEEAADVGAESSPPEQEPASSPEAPPSALPLPSPQAARPSKPAARRQVRRNFHQRGLPPGTQTPIKASRALLEDGKLEAGVVLDLSAVPRDQLVEHDRRLYDRAMEAFPALARRDVYVGVEDHPQTTAGGLELGPKPQVRIGNLRYSLDKAAQKLGMPPEELRREFNRELKHLGLQPR